MKVKTVYISGPITGKDGYWRDFEKAEAEIRARGCIAINPAKLPEGLSNADYMRINFACIDVADAVLLLPGWQYSAGASLEARYCAYIAKPCTDSLDDIINLEV